MRLGAIALMAIGALFGALGFLFLLGAAGQMHRYVIAVLGLASGGFLAGFGLRTWRQEEAASPERLLDEVLDLARRRNGEVGELEVAAVLGRRAQGASALFGRLIAAGLCERHEREGSTYFVFKDLQPRLFVRRCEYCGQDVSIASDAKSCPKCGGTLKMQVERQSLSQGEYRMEE